MIQFSRLLFCLGVLFLSSAPPLWSKNHIHDPSYIFEVHPSGNRAVNPSRATRAALLHLNGVKGQLKNGTPLKAAIIDSSFNPNYTKLLADKGVIHPDALQPGNSYCLAPNENFNESKVYYNRNSELYLQKWSAGSQEEQDIIQRQIDQLTPLLDAENKKNEILRIRKGWYDLFTKKGAGNHGSGVMEALHLIAPKVQLLPIDTLIFERDPLLNAPYKLAKAIRAAIAHRVNAINISFKLSDLNQECMEGMADAVRQGIVIFIAAGNDSTPGIIFRICKVWNSVKGIFVKSNEQKLFEKLQGKGILFAGALGYKRNGEEEVASFSQLPETNMKSRFLLAPGVDIPVHATCPSNKLVNGTSFSSPITAGGYLLLLQHALDKGYPYRSPEALLDILQNSGKKVIYERWWSFSNEEYKSIDLYAAQQLLDRKFKPVVNKPAPKSPAIRKAPLKRLAVRKSAAQKPALRRAAPKKSVVRRGASKRPTIRKAAPKRFVVRRGVAQRPAVRKTTSKNSLKSRRFKRR